ncbi:MAG TPA: tagaturonate epimerase family protein [Bacteroidales bacterium]|nr:tagaturonate epimerase family protein [Bacteroidales bacterium]
MKIIEKYSFGIGDRFTMQGEAQLSAILEANKAGIPVVPVWNKSDREHQIVKTQPADTRKEAENAIQQLNYSNNWYVDADHINLSNVDQYTDSSNFFTLDVADFIGQEPEPDERKKALELLKPFEGELSIPGLKEKFTITHDQLISTVKKFYMAIKEASAIYERIKARRGDDDFVAEVSMDEVVDAQTPVDLFFILYFISHFGIPAQTIAPKFTGRFNKGVDYVGDVKQFKKEFEQDLLVIDYAIREFALPSNLKLSVHSGSDKFSIYPIIRELIKKHNKGIHVKTAGTTWLEEVIGLALSGGSALLMAKSIYRQAYERMDELTAPYANVIDIERVKLPVPSVVDDWSSEKFANTLRHIPGHADYDPKFRQLVHVGYKVAAEMGEKYTIEIRNNAAVVGDQVKENILIRHLGRLFKIDG